ncbi:zinc transporter ZupT [Thermoclostridium stercorarium subsp. stercorarium DSM 8532]|jgi:ZIP family zinc transporter|uniref:Zinc transporter ZupT n=3 Tax=Thermoclostridium stercorarium TaxID=1510 RepID=L7VR07_THES1|nr:zinc transporter ZupT [Thermoclostridium stercorarium]AGC68013.1 zinc transporter ZupT [Thermoclostridium stercorarium subsp. stercorarium DSM 8532]AGI39047.1 transporter [Thermoclostridium stercorarium subsp. stercorarium DSM 8532]ANW98412.1 zinc transporter ZupT [Thermoclostridium stercorarium subsp. thermolacticum DSM 2910]ANX00948.1 zinc transporter ZupT [Thermoclostridium stercorarium subsp. leptospartum DSM 9219]UZQ86554.1 zinc transporter ZupT [Thermoclostridium stercorarium]
MRTDQVLTALLLTLIAGLSTGIGSLIAFFAKKTNTRFLSVALGFSAGVMIYVSMVDIFATAQETLASALGERNGAWVTVASFFGGMLIIALIDKVIPSGENPHDFKKVESVGEEKSNISTNLMRMGLLTALAITIHNFPEGIATFTAALKDPNLGIAITVAIAIHNIPEGIAVSIPVYYATGSKRRAFRLSFLSGLSEPLGAVIGYLILLPFMNDIVFGILFAAVAGIMMFISLDELLPSAREYGEAHLSIYGLISGMMVMAISLLLFI